MIKKNFIEIENESKTIFNKEYFLYAKELKYNRNEKIITSKLDGKLNDRFENLMKFKEFQLDLKTNILKVKNLTINDTDKNTFKLVEAEAINLNSKEIIGNNAKLFLTKAYSGIQKMILECMEIHYLIQKIKLKLLKEFLHRVNSMMTNALLGL